MLTVCKRLWAATFSIFHEKNVQSYACYSSSRTCAVVACLTGCQLALGAEVFAFLHPGESGTVAALMAGVAMLLGGGAVALFTKLKGAVDGGQ